MSVTTEFLINMRKIIKLHEGMLKELGEACDISLLEATIISFLHNNPGKDTAGDIVELRMLQKSNVSQAVELLYKKGFLIRQQDSEDRRRIHNPGKDTAGDIVELRMLQKSNVSQAVELLYKKGFLIRQQDSEDRRRIHLFLTEKAKTVTDSMDKIWKRFEEKAFAGISEEEKKQFIKINEQIKENICSITERSEK